MKGVDNLLKVCKKDSVDKLFLKPDANRKVLLEALSGLFKYAVAKESRKFGSLDELIVNDIDIETIWEELQSRNRPLTRYLRKMATLFAQKAEESSEEIEDDSEANSINEEGDDYSEDYSEGSEEELMDGDDGSVDGISDEEDFDEDQSENSQEDYDGSEQDEDEEDDNDDMNEDIEDVDNETQVDKKSGKRRWLPSSEGVQFDDEEEDMERFLDREDELESKYLDKLARLEEQSRGHKGLLELDEADDEDGDEDDMFLIQNALYGDDDVLDAEITGKGRKKQVTGKAKRADLAVYSDEDSDNDEANHIMHSDFFGDMKSRKQRSKTPVPVKKTVNSSRNLRFADEDYDDYQHGDNIDIEDENDEGFSHDDIDNADDGDSVDVGNIDDAPKTKFERHSAQMKAQIKKLEQDLVAQKSWELQGEITSSARPENSLLEINAEVVRTSRPAPIITQEYTTTLEDIIRRRIKDENFDDVISIDVRSKNVKSGGSDLPELSQEKSKEGLGDIYAQEFLRRSIQFDGKSSELNAKKLEITSLFDQVCRDLDTLSHFFFQPKPVVREASISSSEMKVSSIALEDIIPMTESTSVANAPEEIYDKKRGRQASLLSAEEMTGDDKHRLRLARKSVERKQKKMKLNEEKLVAKLNPGLGNKYEKQKTLEMIRNDKRVVVAKEDNSISKSSTALFEQLQKEAHKSIYGDGKIKSTSKVKDTGKLSSSALKL